MMQYVRHDSDHRDRSSFSESIGDPNAAPTGCRRLRVETESIDNTILMRGRYGIFWSRFRKRRSILEMDSHG